MPRIPRTVGWPTTSTVLSSGSRRSLVALTDGLQLQWLCSTTPQTAAAESLDTDLVAEIRLYVDCLRSQWALQETPETPQRPKAA